MYVVYGLEDPRDNKIWYVGMTSDIYDRFMQHINLQGDNREKNAWIESLKVQNIVPIIRTLETMYTLSDARVREVYWINHYAHLGMPLTNTMLIRSTKEYAIRVPRPPKRDPDVSTVTVNVLPEERTKILQLAHVQKKMYGRVVRTKIRDVLGWNNKDFPKIKQVLDEEGL